MGLKAEDQRDGHVYFRRTFGPSRAEVRRAFPQRCLIKTKYHQLPDLLPVHVYVFTVRELRLPNAMCVCACVTFLFPNLLRRPRHGEVATTPHTISNFRGVKTVRIVRKVQALQRGGCSRSPLAWCSL